MRFPKKHQVGLVIRLLSLHEARRIEDRSSNATGQSNQQSGKEKLILHGVASHEFKAARVCPNRLRDHLTAITILPVLVHRPRYRTLSGSDSKAVRRY
jgi:hypothetical protein